MEVNHGEGLPRSDDKALVNDNASTLLNEATTPSSQGANPEAIEAVESVETPPDDSPSDNVRNYSRDNLAELLPATEVDTSIAIKNDDSEFESSPSHSNQPTADEKAVGSDEDKDSHGLTVSEDEEADADEDDDEASPAYREQLNQAGNSHAVAAAPSEETYDLSEDRRGASVTRHGGRASKADALARLSAPNKLPSGVLQQQQAGEVKQRGWWGRTVSAVGGVLRGQGNAGADDDDDDNHSMASRGSSSGRTSGAAGSSSSSGSSVHSGGAPVRLTARERRDALMAQRAERQQNDASASSNKSWSKPTQALPAAGEAEAEGEVGCAERHTFGKWMLALFEANGDFRAVSTLKRVDGPVFW